MATIGSLVIEMVANSARFVTGMEDCRKMTKSFQNDLKDMQRSLNVIKTNAFIEIGQQIFSAMKQLHEFVEIGARAEAVSESFDIITKSSGIMSRKLIDDIKQASGVFVDETEIMVKAQRLLVEGFESAQIVKITEASRIAARKMGIDVATAYEQVTEALITGRVRTLKAAFPLDIAVVEKQYADSLGISSKYLTEAGKQQALYNEIMKQTNEYKAKFGELAANAYEGIQREKSAFQELKEEISKSTLALAGWLANLEKAIVTPYIEWILALKRAHESMMDTLNSGWKKLGEMIGIVKPGTPDFSKIYAGIGTGIIEKQKKDEGDRFQKQKDLLKIKEDQTKLDSTSLQKQLEIKSTLALEVGQIDEYLSLQKQILDSKLKQEEIDKKGLNFTQLRKQYELEWAKIVTEANTKEAVSLEAQNKLSLKVNDDNLQSAIKLGDKWSEIYRSGIDLELQLALMRGDWEEINLTIDKVTEQMEFQIDWQVSMNELTDKQGEKLKEQLRTLQEMSKVPAPVKPMGGYLSPEGTEALNALYTGIGRKFKGWGLSISELAENEYKKEKALRDLNIQYADLLGNQQTSTQAVLKEAQAYATLQEGTRAWSKEASEQYMKIIKLQELQKTESYKLIQGVADTITSSFSSNMTQVLQHQQTFAEAMKNIWSDLASYIISQLLKIAAQQALMGSFTNVSGAWGGGAGGGLIGIVGSLFKMQEGGIVNRPSFAMLGERGPEAVIPLDKSGAIGKSNIIIIQANDAQSFNDMCQRNPGGILNVLGIDAKQAGVNRIIKRGF